MTTARSQLLEQPPADRTADSIIIPSRSNPFVEYTVDAAAGRCSCPARPGKCWHLKIARVSLQSGVPVKELMYRLKRAKDLGGCGAETCQQCLSNEICWQSPKYLMAYESMMMIQRLEQCGF